MRRFVFLLAVFPLLGTLPALKPSQAQGANHAKALPSWAEIQQKVNEVFARRENYQNGDIICKSEAQKAIAKVEEMGWKPLGAAEIVSRVPDDNEFIVTQLRRKDGWDFMRHVARYPEGYDRLDRMVHLPRGETFTQALITNPGGYRMIEYMTTSPGGVEMGRMLRDAPHGKNFNQPTGRIYTADEFLAQLHKGYPQQKAR